METLGQAAVVIEAERDRLNELERTAPDYSGANGQRIEALNNALHWLKVSCEVVDAPRLTLSNNCLKLLFQ